MSAAATMEGVFESTTSSDESPMRLNGSSASSASVASRLYGTRSRRDSLGSDPELISFSDSDMHEQVPFHQTVMDMNKRMSEMQELHQMNLHLNDDRSRLKTENAVLNERVHVLEEQLSITEQRYKEQLQEEKARTKELLSRSERERQLEMESLNLKQQMADKDAVSSKRDVDKLRDELKKSQEQVEHLKGELAESRLLVEDLEEERIKLEKQFKKYKEEAQQDIDSSSEMVEVLTQQTEELRRRAHPRQSSIADQMVGLEEEMDRARGKIRDLESERDDLQAQLLAASVERGQSLLADAPSLAEELIGGDSQKLLEALREQEMCNQKLRVYINGILMRVIERHPEILEIRDCELTGGDNGAARS